MKVSVITITQCAKDLSLSTTYMNSICAGRLMPSEKIIKAIREYTKGIVTKQDLEKQVLKHTTKRLGILRKHTLATQDIESKEFEVLANN